VARSLGLRLGLGRSGCSGCGRRRAGRRGARCALLRLRPVLPRTLLSGPGACVLRLSAAGTWLSAAGTWLSAAGTWLSAAGTWLSAAGAWLSSAGARPCRAARHFRWRPSGLLRAAIPII
jgi:hypothetical protein